MSKATRKHTAPQSRFLSPEDIRRSIKRLVDHSEAFRELLARAGVDDHGAIADRLHDAICDVTRRLSAVPISLM